jgi:AAA+ ATPase superfamily predicted ATPase
MNFTEILQFVDNLVYSQTEKHLDDIQTSILKGVLNGQEYAEIADKIHKSEGHVRNIGYKLFKNISDGLKENTDISKSLQETITKSNFCSAMERLKLSNNFGDNNVGNNSHNVNIYNNNSPPSEIQNNPSSPPEQKNIKLPIQYLKNAPIISDFYGRETEINTLKDYIFNQKYNLISILGILGIGKTPLIGKLVEEIKAEFEIVIWHNIDSNKSLNDTLTQILKTIDNTQEIPETIDAKQNLLIEILDKQKCLLIFDNIQNLFTSGKYSGHYQTQHIKYQTLWSKIIKQPHQSCVILISNEKPKEIAEIELNQHPVGILELKGLKEDEAKELLQEKKLTDENHWTELINMYQGNPLWLNNIALMINEVCEGKVGELVADNQLSLPDDLALKINEVYQRLSEIEKQILEAIASETSPITRAELQQKLSLSKNNIFNGIQSLIRRYLIVKIAQEPTKYNILDILREFIISQ